LGCPLLRKKSRFSSERISYDVFIKDILKLNCNNGIKSEYFNPCSGLHLSEQEKNDLEEQFGKAELKPDQENSLLKIDWKMVEEMDRELEETSISEMLKRGPKESSKSEVSRYHSCNCLPMDMTVERNS
jgi:hypothetical protein